MKYLLLIIPCCMLLACQTAIENKPDTSKEPIENTSKQSITLADQIPGTWSTVMLKVDFTSYGKEAGKDSTLKVFKKDFPEVLQIGGNEGTYEKDGDYHGAYLGLDGKPLMTTTGSWTSKGDSLYLTQTTPAPMEHNYFVRINGDTLYSGGKVDFDGDGEADDLIYGKAVRVNHTAH